MPNWKKLIYSGSDANLNSLNITNGLTASGLIYPSVDGDDSQVITTDGSGNLEWSDVNLYARVKNISGGTLSKGTPVHATSSASPPSGNISEVIAASASVASTMPATFVLNEDVADGAEGSALLVGYINGINTSAFNEGDVVYVGINGGFTNIKPQGSSNLIQNLGIVTKVDALNGSGYVYGSGRSNDIPNLPTGKVWVGSSTHSVTSSVIHLDELNQRLGVNTSTPTKDLEVSGSALISSAITASSAQLTNLPSSTEDIVLVIDAEGNVGTKELQYTGGGYVATQSTPSSVWTITHNLNTRPLNVDIYDDNYNLIITEIISYPTVDTARIEFDSSRSGYAIFSSISASYTSSEDNLQMVTNRGNTTTNDMIITSSLAGNTYTLLSTGSIETTSDIDVGGLLTVTGIGTSQFSSHLQSHCLGVGTPPSTNSGTIVASSTVTATNFITTSDKKLKSNIVAISESLDTLKQFTAYEYTKDGLPDAGFIAQEVQEVLPYAVFTDDNGYLTMNDRPILAHMHKAILELEKRLKVIENKLG
jgi:hypothetical protein